METPYRYKFRLVGLSLGVILALLIWPATRRIVLSQIALCSPTPATAVPWSTVVSWGNVPTQNTQAASQLANQRYHETTAHLPDDFQVQFAAAVAVPSAEGSLPAALKVQRLRALVERFPDRPTLYAAILRFATQEQIRAERAQESILTGEPQERFQPAVTKSRNTPEQLRAFDRDAAAGERLDPNNAYFPMMRAVGLFAARRDTEALAAIERAAQKSGWTEYYGEEVEAEWKLQEETFGTVSALPRMAFAAGLLLPHYSQLRAVSRVAIVAAVKAELAGHAEEGFRIRTAVRRCGGLMRVQSVCVLGAMVGNGIGQTALARPGGAPPLPRKPNRSDASRREQVAHAYDAYVQRIGHPEESATADAETSAGIQAREIAKFASHSPAFDDPWKLVLFWMAAVLLLSNALWMLALGGGATLLTRHRRIRTGLGLPPSLRAGVALGLFAGPLSAGAVLLHPVQLVCMVLLAGVSLFSILALALPGAKGAERVHRLGIFGLTLLSTALLCSAFGWQAGGSIEPIVPFLSLSRIEGAELRMPLISVLSVGLAATIPLVTLLTLGLLSRIWGVPLSVGVVRGLRGCAVPIACLLLLAYSLLVPMTLRQESVLEARMQRTVQHEGRFMAEMIGRHWPDAAP